MNQHHLQEKQIIGLPNPTPHMLSKTSFANKSLGSDVSHRRKHGDASVLQFGLAAALEVLNAAIGGEACGIPKVVVA